MDDPRRARMGLWNAVVYGRMVTFALQNMQHGVPGYKEWYDHYVAIWKLDELMIFFRDLRTQIEKTVKPTAAAFGAVKALDLNIFATLPRLLGPPRSLSATIMEVQAG